MREPIEVMDPFRWIGGMEASIPRAVGESYADAYERRQNEKVKGKDLLIIAPEHKLNTRGKVKEGHILKIKDPIVLQPVDKGYLIVSSWGLEASDELVVNPVSN